jgi:hypothetical protein
LADQDPIIGQNTMPYPADVSGPALINYRQVLDRPDDANMFSSLIHGDPATPLLRAYAGDPVKVHVLGAPGSEQVHVFNLGGMSWPGDMYIHNASQWQSRAVGPWEKVDIQISGGAGGAAQSPGDYFYGDMRRAFTQAGMWGIFRVLPNTCNTGGVAGVPCLVQAPPTVTGINPASGPAAGGTVVTVTGTNFNTSSTAINFGANAATNVSCASSTTCTATSPSGSGIADVTVTVAGLTSAVNNNDEFTYEAPVPSVTGIAPNSGLTDGGTVVTISGTNFSTTPAATTVMFGANPASNVSCSSATSCTATSPSGSAGIVDVVVTVGGESSATSNADQFTYVDAPPTVISSTLLNASVNNLSTVWFSVTFSEAVNGVDMADFSLNTSGGISGASVESVTGSGATRSVSVNTGTGDGMIRLDVADNDSIFDSSSNPLGGGGSQNFTSGQSYMIDKSTPTVASSTLLNAAINARSIVFFTVTFSETVTGVGAADFNLTTTGGLFGATVVSVTGTGSTRTVGVDTGAGSGTLRLNVVDDDSILDSVNNSLGGIGVGNGAFITGQTYTIDRTAPSVVSSVRANASPSNRTTVFFTVTFSESVIGVDAADFTLTNTGVSGASITSVTGSGATRTVGVNSGTGNGTIRLDVADNDSILDGAGNRLGGTGAGNGAFTTGQIYTVDKTGPSVISSVRMNSNPTTRTTVFFRVTFSEVVTGVNAADFSLTAPGITGASVTSVTGTGTTRTIGVNTGTGSGTIRLNVVDDDSILDSAGNRLGGTGSGNGNFNTGPFYNVR